MLADRGPSAQLEFIGPGNLRVHTRCGERATWCKVGSEQAKFLLGRIRMVCIAFGGRDANHCVRSRGTVHSRVAREMRTCPSRWIQRAWTCDDDARNGGRLFRPEAEGKGDKMRRRVGATAVALLSPCFLTFVAVAIGRPNCSEDVSGGDHGY